MLREFPLPEGTEEQVEAWARDPGTPAPPRQAATVVLLRDGDRGVEVFLLRRRLSMAFAAGMYAFPGGGVDPRDAAADVPWTGPDPAWWAERLRCTELEARAFVCAAVRETFEECGLLLVGGDVAGDDPTWETERQRLLSREVAMSDLLRRRGLHLRSDLLRPWAHWTTPEHEPRRFDTRILVALAPDGQNARHVGGEADAAGWWPASDVLAAVAHGQVRMLPPTLVTLEEVAAAPDAGALWSQARVLREVMPTLARRGDRLVMLADLPEQPVARR
ncbi:MAG: NUDIX hydrolase [Actinomycetota bacterium]